MTNITTVKQHDTHDTIWTSNMDLSGGTVRLLAKNTDSKVVTTLACSLVSGDVYSVKHTLTGTLTPGDYEVELESTKAGVIRTSPSGGYAILRVVRDLG
jgi:hypothetical protein